MPEIYSHTVLYTLRDANMAGKDGKKRYKAQPLKAGNVVDHNQLCKQIGQMAGIPATSVDAVLRTLPDALGFFMTTLGEKVSISGVGYFGLEITGSCPEDALEEPFDKHFKVNPYFRMAPSLRKQILKHKLSIIHQATDLNPMLIQKVYNSRQTNDNTLVRGEAFKVQGKHLGFNPDAEDEGLFLRYPNKRTEHRFTGVMISTTELITAFPPDIPVGEGYEIEVRTRLRNATPASKPTSRRYHSAIAVI